MPDDQEPLKDKDKIFVGLNELTETIVSFAMETAKEDGLPYGGLPSAMFNAYQEVVYAQVEVCANSLGPDSAISYIGVQMLTIKNFVEVMQGFETQIIKQKEEFEKDHKKNEPR